MIEDLDGTTVEPVRRGHVIALSAATAAISLVLLVALVVPPERVSRATSQLGVNVKVVSECADGSRIDQPYYLVFEGNGQVMAVPLDTSAAQSVPFTGVDGERQLLTVSCATSSDRIPPVDRRR